MRAKLLSVLLKSSALCAIVLVGLVVGLSGKVNQINCRVNDQPCSDTIRTSLASVRGSRLFFTDHHSWISQQLAPLGYELTALTRSYPDQLWVELRPVNQSYLLQVVDDKSVYQVVASGLLFPVVSSDSASPQIVSQVPLASLVTAHQPLRLREPIQLFLDKALTDLNQEHIAVSSFTIIDDQTAQLQLTDPQPLRVLLAIESDTQAIRKLKIILSQVKLSELDVGITQIDLRFRLPVLQTKPQ